MNDESSLTKSNDTHLTSKVIEESISYEINSPQNKISKNQIIDAISLNLEDIIKDNYCYEKYIIKDKFYLPIIPEISINDYINRIVKNTNMNISTLINAIIYIDNYCERNKYILCWHNIHLILLTSCLLSFKFNEDNPLNMEFYAKIGGIPLQTLNHLEYLFYLNLHFSLYIKEDLYSFYYNYFSNYLIPSKIKCEKNTG